MIYNSVFLHADILALILIFFKGSIRRSFISVTKCGIIARPSPSSAVTAARSALLTEPGEDSGTVVLQELTAATCPPPARSPHPLPTAPGQSEQHRAPRSQAGQEGSRLPPEGPRWPWEDKRSRLSTASGFTGWHLSWAALLAQAAASGPGQRQPPGLVTSQAWSSVCPAQRSRAGCGVRLGRPGRRPTCT